ncbi:hypothetical protein B0J14DRAFT_554916 [Halenospora varia]|nr:hypothetical protein B0J14DRAFT_554916 [Halenospora varia]
MLATIKNMIFGWLKSLPGKPKPSTLDKGKMADTSAPQAHKHLSHIPAKPQTDRYFQHPVFDSCTYILKPFIYGTTHVEPADLFNISPLDPPAPVGLGDTGYNTAAIASYQKFYTLREEGIIPGGVRFQVSLPAPHDVIAWTVKLEYAIEAEAAYEAKPLYALANIQASIPASDLPIQWDTPNSIAILENQAFATP